MKNVILLWCVFLLCSFSVGVENTIWISDLDLSLVDLEMGQAQKNKTPMGSPIVISGETYENGLAVSAPAKFLIELNGSAKQFSVLVGPCEMRMPARPEGQAPAGNNTGTPPAGAPPAGGPAGNTQRIAPSMQFYVLGDKKILWDSGVMKQGDKPQNVELDLSGINKMALVVVSRRTRPVWRVGCLGKCKNYLLRKQCAQGNLRKGCCQQYSADFNSIRKSCTKD